MIICVNCQALQLEGSVFCSECGASIVAMHAPQILARAAADASGRSSTSESLAAQPHIPSLTLIASTSGRTFMVSKIDDPVLIGRRDDARGIYPGVDLGAEGGYDAGVSRKHATLTQRQGIYYIEDLGSANGTFVNGKQIAPQTPISIAHGDELRCGMLRLHIEIK